MARKRTSKAKPAGPAADKLTPRQQKFVQEYQLDLNATAAYKRAGYSGTGRSAENAASRLLGNVGVQAAIKAANAERARNAGVTNQRVIDELAAVAFSDLGELVEFTAGGFTFKPADQVSALARRSVAAIKVRREEGGEDRPKAQLVEFKLWPKVSALQLLAQHLGMLRVKHEHSGPGGKPIQTEAKVIIYLPKKDGDGRDSTAARPPAAVPDLPG